MVVEGALREGVIGDGELGGWFSYLGVWRRLLRSLWADGVARRGFCFSFVFLFFSPCLAESTTAEKS